VQSPNGKSFWWDKEMLKSKVIDNLMRLNFHKKLNYIKHCSSDVNALAGKVSQAILLKEEIHNLIRLKCISVLHVKKNIMSIL
jgi:hypothetical protein